MRARRERRRRRGRRKLGECVEECTAGGETSGDGTEGPGPGGWHQHQRERERLLFHHLRIVSINVLHTIYSICTNIKKLLVKVIWCLVRGQEWWDSKT